MALESALSNLRVTHPSVPPLRDFQVTFRHSSLHQLPASRMIFPKILLFRWTYWSAPRVPLIPRTSCALCRRASARRCRCCFWDTFCLKVTIYFRSGLTLVLNRVYNYDRGPPHPNRAAASGRLQEVGLDSPCWQPGVESIQSAPFLSKFTPQKDNFVLV